MQTRFTPSTARKSNLSRPRKLAAVTLIALSGALLGITVLAQNYPPIQADKVASTIAAPEAAATPAGIPLGAVPSAPEVATQKTPDTHTRVGNPVVYPGI